MIKFIKEIKYQSRKDISEWVKVAVFDRKLHVVYNNKDNYIIGVDPSSPDNTLCTVCPMPGYRLIEYTCPEGDVSYEVMTEEEALTNIANRKK